MKDSKDREIIELREQFRRAYAMPYKLEKMPEMGDFLILPMSSGDDLGNLQRMVEIDIDRDVASLFKDMNVEGEQAEFKKDSAFRLVAAREVSEQRNRILRAQVVPPEKLKAVWAWVASKKDEQDPLTDVLPKPALNELFIVVQKVTAGSYQLTESGEPNAELAAKK